MDPKYSKATWEGMLNVLSVYVFLIYDIVCKIYDFKFKTAAFVATGKEFVCAYDMENLKALGRVIVDNCLEDENYLSYVMTQCERTEKELQNMFEEIDSTNLQELDYKELVILYDKLNHALCELVAWFLAESVSMVLVDYVDQELNKLSLENKDMLKYKNILLDAAFMPYAEQEERKLLEIYKVVDKNKLETSEIEDNPEVMALLEKHQQKYYWLNNNYYNAEELSVDYFIKRLAEFKPRDLDKLKTNRAEEVKAKKQTVLDKLKSEKLEQLSKVIDQYAYLHDHRKIWLLEYQAYLWKILDEFARRNGLSREEIRWYTMEEIQKDIKPDPKVVEERQKLVVGLYYQGNKSVLIGEEAKKWQQDVSKQDEQASDKLKGMTACSGKVTGKVRVLHNVDELDKIQEGEILVASNTTPDYLPAMKKAVAFLTEKGGITSHAAIVSREMNKPCIVGIVAITKKLKDGMMVEVDANQGIVKILK